MLDILEHYVNFVNYFLFKKFKTVISQNPLCRMASGFFGIFYCYKNFLLWTNFYVLVTNFVSFIFLIKLNIIFNFVTAR